MKRPRLLRSRANLAQCAWGGAAISNHQKLYSRGLISWHAYAQRLAVKMKAELQEVMNMLRKLQGAIDFGNAPLTEREELASDVADIMDSLFELMKKLPDE